MIGVALRKLTSIMGPWRDVAVEYGYVGANFRPAPGDATWEAEPQGDMGRAPRCFVEVSIIPDNNEPHIELGDRSGGLVDCGNESSLLHAFGF